MDTMPENDFCWRFRPSIGAEVAVCKSLQEFCTLKMAANKFFFQKPFKTGRIKFGRVQAGWNSEFCRRQKHPDARQGGVAAGIFQASRAKDCVIYFLR